MRRVIEMLSEVKESIINAYQIKTGLDRAKLSNLMDAETWMNSRKAVELKFADGILEDAKRAAAGESADPVTFAFSRRAVTNSLLDKVQPKATAMPTNEPKGTPIKSLDERLTLISGGIRNV